MRTLATLLSTGAILLGATVVGWTEDAAKKESTDTAAKAADAKAQAVFVQLRVKELRTLADLIEAQNAEKPDQAKIETLVKELQQLRIQMHVQRMAICGRPGGPMDGPMGKFCPWGGPGRGPGCGMGPGAGYGRGMGPGPGWGGGGRGGRPGPGGPGGQGFGPGPDMGPDGPGPGMPPEGPDGF
jgi:hypothetical protein